MNYVTRSGDGWSPARRSSRARRTSRRCSNASRRAPCRRRRSRTGYPTLRKPRCRPGSMPGRRRWSPGRTRTFVTQAQVNEWVLADLEKIDRRARRFQRYFTFTHLYNAGVGRRRVAHLSQRPVQADQLAVLASEGPESGAGRPARDCVPHRPALVHVGRDHLEPRYCRTIPTAILDDGVTSRVIAVFTAAKVPVLRGDWFVATASRPPLYQDILQLPGQPGRTRTTTPRRRRAEHRPGTRDAGGVQRLGHLEEQPRPRTARRRPRLLLADVRLRGGAAKPDRSRAPGAGSAKRVRLPARTGERREHVPARGRRSHLQPAERTARLLHHGRQQQPVE